MQLQWPTMLMQFEKTASEIDKTKITLAETESEIVRQYIENNDLLEKFDDLKVKLIDCREHYSSLVVNEILPDEYVIPLSEELNAFLKELYSIAIGLSEHVLQSFKVTIH